MIERLKQYGYLIRIHKPIGVLLLLWPTLWALWLANGGMPSIKCLVIFVLGVVVMRSAGCIINDIADRNIDGFVERTRDRPLATQKLTVNQALGFFAILLGVAFLLVLMLNPFAIMLAFVGLCLAMLYPFLKRWTHLPQLGLGLAFSWGIPMAFAAVSNAIPAKAWLLFAAAVIWPVIYDTQYAMTDKQDDEKIGVKSTAVLLGDNVRLFVGMLQVFFVLFMLVVGYAFDLNLLYSFSLCCVGVFFIYQQILMKDGVAKRFFQAFLNNNWVGLTLFIGIVLGLA